MENRIKEDEFTSRQQRKILQYYENIQKELGEDEINASNLVKVIQKYFPIDEKRALTDCRGIEEGMKRFEELYVCKKKNEFFQAKELLEQITEDKNEQQKKGLYLMLYDALRKADAAKYQEAAVAKEGCEVILETEETEIRELVCEQMDLKAEELVLESINEEEPNVVIEDTIPNPMILGTAIYCASLEGTIVEEFEQNTELTGVCSAACTNLVEKIKENPQNAKNPVWTANIVKGVFITALFVIVMVIAEPHIMTIEMIRRNTMVSTGSILKKCLTPIIQITKLWTANPLMEVGRKVSSIFTSIREKIRHFYENKKSERKLEDQIGERNKKKQREVKKQYL